MVSDSDQKSEGESTEPKASKAGQASGSSPGADIGAELAEVRERLGVQQTPFLVAAVVLALAAFAVSTIAHIIYLTADGGDTWFDMQVTLQLGQGAALIAAALLVLVRWQAGPRGKVDPAGPDLKIALGVAGLIAAFCLVGLFKAFDESWEAQDSWFSYARVYAILLVGWLVVARPVPETIGTMASTMIGLIALGVAAVTLIIGEFMGISNDFSTYVNGVAFQNLGTVAVIMALGWFLGLQPKGN